MQNMSATGRLPSNSTCRAAHCKHNAIALCLVKQRVLRLATLEFVLSCMMWAVFLVCLVPAERCHTRWRAGRVLGQSGTETWKSLEQRLRVL